MTPAEVVGSGVALVVTTGAGVVAHELSHAIALRAFGVSYDLEWLPDGDTTDPLGAIVDRGLASVWLRGIPGDLAPWKLRASPHAASPVDAVRARSVRRRPRPVPGGERSPECGSDRVARLCAAQPAGLRDGPAPRTGRRSGTRGHAAPARGRGRGLRGAVVAATVVAVGPSSAPFSTHRGGSTARRRCARRSFRTAPSARASSSGPTLWRPRRRGWPPRSRSRSAPDGVP